MKSLTTRARRLFPTKRNAARWVLAVRYMRRREGSIWVMDGAKPNWGNQTSERKAA